MPNTYDRDGRKAKAPDTSWRICSTDANPVFDQQSSQLDKQTKLTS